MKNVVVWTPGPDHHFLSVFRHHATEWSESRARYVVTTRNGHAWIEVAFEGVGWVGLDPTPGPSREAAIAALEADPSEGFGAWMGVLIYDLEQWIATGDRDFMRAFASALVHGPRAVWNSLRRAPWLALPLVMLILFAVRRRLAGRERSKTADPRRWRRCWCALWPPTTAINSEINLITYETRLDSSNVMEIFADYDIIVDGTDNFPTRFSSM